MYKFFYMYVCFFKDLHMEFLFDEFTIRVLWVLNVGPTQLSLVGSLQSFHLL